jgi:plastocyanin
MHTTTTIRRRVALVAACFVTAVSFSACGSDDDNASDAPDETPATTDTADETPATTVADDAPAGETIVVTAVDYGFEGLPETVPVGTKISLVNEGNEPHEFVAMPIPADETRSVEELVQLPEEELGEVFGAGEPATVILAATGQTDVPGAVVGDGTLTEPGRYAIVCFLPVGSDDSILESDGPPPEGADAMPHAMQGMIAELTVVP